MAFGSFGGSARNSAPMAEINVIPLVDIMLVLLVIFIVTAPLLSHAVKIDLPKAESTPALAPPQAIQFAIDAAGQQRWNGEPVGETALRERLAAAGRQPVVPELHLHIDRQARYEAVAELLSAAARAGMTKIAFVTDPALAPAAGAQP